MNQPSMDPHFQGDAEDLVRYPIGKYTAPTELSPDQRDRNIQAIEEFPDKVQDLVSQAGTKGLSASYRPGGWTMQQIIHHCADSHMNAYIRHKLTVAENNPTVKPYEQDDWAEMEDAKNNPPDASVKLLQGLHSRWAMFLRSVKEADWERTFYHPETKKTVPLYETVAHYAWHCDHHLGQMRGCMEAAGRLQ